MICGPCFRRGSILDLITIGWMSVDIRRVSGFCTRFEKIRVFRTRRPTLPLPLGARSLRHWEDLQSDRRLHVHRCSRLVATEALNVEAIRGGEGRRGARVRLLFQLSYAFRAGSGAWASPAAFGGCAAVRITDKQS